MNRDGGSVDRPGHSTGNLAEDESNPFRPGADADQAPEPRGRPNSDPSIDHEPHLQAGPLPEAQVRADAEAERRAERSLHPDADLSDADKIEHTVWDEPALAGALSGPAPADQLTYARWLDREIAKTTETDTWRTTLLVSLAAGPWGVLGALIAQAVEGSVGFSGVLAAVFLAPVTEEITKIAVALWVVEKRPFRFHAPHQILICAAAGGLAFASIENLIYLTIYSPGQGAGYVAWRLIVCTGLHVVCSTIAGLGLVKVWENAIDHRRRPELADGMPFFTAAMVLHGVYNAAATVVELAAG